MAGLRTSKLSLVNPNQAAICDDRTRLGQLADDEVSLVLSFRACEGRTKLALAAMVRASEERHVKAELAARKQTRQTQAAKALKTSTKPAASVASDGVVSMDKERQRREQEQAQKQHDDTMYLEYVRPAEIGYLSAYRGRDLLQTLDYLTQRFGAERLQNAVAEMGAHHE